MNIEIKEKLRALRLEAGYTQKEMAKKINSTDKNVWAYEKGLATPPHEILVAYARAFNVSTDYLLDLEDDFGVKSITPEERAAGASETKTVKVTPAEDELLYLFREIGKKHGEKGQQSVLNIAENLLNLSDKD